MKKLTLSDLCENKDWETAVIVFTPESFNREYSVESRSYGINRDNKYFQSEMCGTSLYGFCLDGTDQGVRLDWYFGDWKIDYCYITK